MIFFPVFRELHVGNYRLFPGADQKHSVRFPFRPGVSLVAGVNGLGKTTLINMLYRLLVGPYEIPKDNSARGFSGAARDRVSNWDDRKRFFSVRVADHAVTARARLEFSIANRDFIVSRALKDCSLIEVKCNYLPLEQNAGESLEAAYQRHIAAAAGVSSFADFLTVIKYLTFFNEDRRDIVWDRQAQRQFFRILFTTPETAAEWTRLEVEISRADSRARNYSTIADQTDKEIRSLSEALNRNSGVAAQLESAQKILDADLERKKQMEIEVGALEEELKKLKSTLERTKLTEDDAVKRLEELRYTALARLFPSLDETARYILTHLFAKGRCQACDADAGHKIAEFEHALEQHLCAICGAPPEAQGRAAAGAEVVAPPEALEARRIDGARRAVDDARTQRLSLVSQIEEGEARRREILQSLEQIAVSISGQMIANRQLRSQLPPDPEQITKKRQTYRDMRASEAEWISTRKAFEREYEIVLEQNQEAMRQATLRVARYFKEIAQKFLEEACDLTFVMTRGRPSQDGEYFMYPAMSFEMTAAAFEGLQPRITPDDVSESQREFIDLAFRMALMEAASREGPATLVIETPEASLDIVFMRRAGELLRSFAQGERRVIITSNLTNSEMIPAVMGGRVRDEAELQERRARTLDLLEVAAPNAAVRRHKREYKDFLDAGLRGGLP